MGDIIVRVKNNALLETAGSYDGIDVIIADFGCSEDSLLAAAEKYPKRRIYIQLPDVLREKRAESVEKIAERAMRFDGVVIKNLDEAGLIRKILHGAGKKTEVIGDAFLYAYNSSAVAFYKQLFADMRFIASDEISDREVGAMIRKCEEKGVATGKDFIYKAYGHQPLMITDRCINRTYAGCMNPLMRFRDEKNNDFYVTSECGQCYDIIYNGLPSFMPEPAGELKEMIPHILLDFTIESAEKMREVMDHFLEGKALALKANTYTRGHHLKGCW